MEKSNLDRLIERYLTGDATDEERVKLEAWLDVMKTKEGSDRELSEADEERVFQQLTNRITRAEESIASQPEFTQPSSHPRAYFKLAAAFALLLIAGYSLWYVAKKFSQHENTFTASRDIEKVLLKDGSLVWLHKNSTLEYYQDEGNSIRQAKLTGEALFEVAKDASKPFQIACGNVTVRVVGTSFNLRSENNTVELQVLTGEVNVSTGDDREGVVVLPNEVAIYQNEKLSERKSLTAIEKEVITDRTDYNMDFVNTSMEQVVQRMEAKFNVQVTFEYQDLRRCRVTGNFTDYSLEKTLFTLSELLDLSYVVEGQAVMLKGKGCP